jgi:hypothetical protein
MADQSSSSDNSCVVFLSDKAYFNKFLNTCNQLIVNGKYKGDICLVIGDDLNENIHQLSNHPFITQNKITIKYFPNIKFPDFFLKIAYEMKRPEHWFKKIFQYHKLHLFNSFFKQWKYIFYLDSGLTILNDIQPILNEKIDNTLLAHSDAFPSYEWRLHNQFCKNNSDYINTLNKKFNLNIDYFQTTIMLYDTSIIEDNTFDNLYKLTLEFPISITNDQGIIALYFSNIKPLWKQIKTRNENIHFYDYMKRQPSNNYIMLKSV